MGHRALMARAHGGCQQRAQHAGPIGIVGEVRRDNAHAEFGKRIKERAAADLLLIGPIITYIDDQAFEDWRYCRHVLPGNDLDFGD